MDIQTLQFIATAILALTFIVAIWQTILTRRAVVAQRRNFELEASPWLTGSSLKPEVVEEDPLQLQIDAYLMIKNIGKTPAIQVSVKSQWKIFKEGEKKALHGEEGHLNITIAPEDESHVQLCCLEFEDPRQKARINTVITYLTFFGGKGEVGLSFFQDDDGGWYNGPTTYKFTDSDGKEYGVPSRLPGLGETIVIPKEAIRREDDSEG